MSLITEVVISWLSSMSTFLKMWRRSESEIMSFSLMVFTVQPAPLRSPMMYCSTVTGWPVSTIESSYQELIQLYMLHLPPLLQQPLELPVHLK